MICILDRRGSALERCDRVANTHTRTQHATRLVKVTEVRLVRGRLLLRLPLRLGRPPAQHHHPEHQQQDRQHQPQRPPGPPLALPWPLHSAAIPAIDIISEVGLPLRSPTTLSNGQPAGKHRAPARPIEAQRRRRRRGSSDLGSACHNQRVCGRGCKSKGGWIACQVVVCEFRVVSGLLLLRSLSPRREA